MSSSNDIQYDINLDSVTVEYHKSKDETTTALRDFSLQAKNQFVAFLGPNGSGKSTLLKLIAQAIQPTKGKVHAPRTRNSMSMVFQSFALDELLTSKENLIIAGALHNVSKNDTLDRIQKIATELSIEDHLDTQVKHLSGGLARRVDLARALISQPKILMLDEPTTGLDIDARRMFWDTIEKIHSQESITILLATHLTSEAMKAERVCMLRDGELIQDNTPTILCRSLGSRTLRIVPPSEAEFNRTCNWLNEQRVRFVVNDRLIIADHFDITVTEDSPIFSLSHTIGPPSLDDVYSYYAAGSDIVSCEQRGQS